MPSAYSIPSVYEEEIQGAIDAGYYSNKSEVVRDALRTFFETKPNLRKAAAIELYKKNRITLARAAELCNLTSIEFKEILNERGIKIILSGKTQPEMKKQMQLMNKVRASK